MSSAIHSFTISIDSPLEIVCTRVAFPTGDLIFCACYRSPSSTTNFCTDLHDVLNKLVVRYPKSHLFLLGDFNFPNIVWQNGVPSLKQSSSECTHFLDICADFNLTQLIHEPTRTTSASSNTLDLFLQQLQIWFLLQHTLKE